MTDFFADLEAQLRTAHGRRPSRARRAAAPAAAALAVAAALALVLALGGGSPTREAAAPRKAGAPPLSVPTTPVPAPARPAGVAVLNGTTRPGLGRQVAARLSDDGFRIDIVTDAARHDTTTTRVTFRGRDASTALAVAARLRVHLVGPLRAEDAAFAGRDAKVVVIVGADAADRIVGAPPPVVSSVLFAPPGANRPVGHLTIGRGRMQVMATGLGRHTYAVWLTASRRPARLLGYTPIPDAHGRLRFTNPLPPWSAPYTGILMTRGTGNRPGPIVLRGVMGVSRGSGRQTP